EVGGEEDLGRYDAVDLRQGVFDEPAAGGAPEAAKLEDGLARLDIGREGGAIGGGIRDEAEAEAFLEQRGLAKVLAGGQDAAFQQDGVDVLASRAAERRRAGFESAERASQSGIGLLACPGERNSPAL